MMHRMDALRAWIDGLAAILWPRRARPALATVPRTPRPVARPPTRGGGGVYRPLKG